MTTTSTHSVADAPANSPLKLLLTAVVLTFYMWLFLHAESQLAVADSLEAALGVQQATLEQMREGVEATHKQLSSALEKHRVVAIAPAQGDKFDPAQHQAISMVPADQPAQTVVALLQKGYLIADRVLRPALVTVAAPQ